MSNPPEVYQPIRVLSPEVAATIAAGEMIERPFSVVKELVENSIDAQATVIAIDVARGGTDSIRVTDNGIGIPEKEIELAFARHSTSKLTHASDLERILTLGFRGEALSSIVAVADVALISRTSDSDSAYKIAFVHGEQVRREIVSGTVGTIVKVDRLFHHLPARRKYLKSTQGEFARILQTIGHFAIAYPSIQFLLTNDGKSSFTSSGNGSRREAISAMYGVQVSAELLEIDPPITSDYRVTGLIGTPAVARTNRIAVNIYINNRRVQSRALQIAVEESYRGFLTVGHYPLVAVFLEIPADQLDPNVHPMKREVRLLFEDSAFSSLQKAIRQTLTLKTPYVGIFQLNEGGLRPGQSALDSLEEMGEGQRSLSSPPGMLEPATLDKPIEASRASLGALKVIGQIGRLYIVTEGPTGIVLIDQHAAHEQVLFENIEAEIDHRDLKIQQLLEPFPMELTPAQQEVMEIHHPRLTDFGFFLDHFGANTWLVRAVPAMTVDVSLTKLIEELLELLSHAQHPVSNLYRSLVTSIACHSAVRAGMPLQHQEMIGLVDSLSSAQNPRHCPHGRPTTLLIDKETLDREFRRT